MTNRLQRAALTALCVAGFAMAAAAQLNPTVTVLGVPTTAVPAGCDQSLAPQAAPRVQVEEIPEPAKRKANAPPPAASLRAQLKDVQAAADRGDRSAFGDALTRVKTTVSTYATGGEKDAARDAIRVYDDLDRIWTYQMETPTGAFFDSTSVPAQVMRNYPGFEREIADQTFTDSHGTRFYPTTETRQFLVREAAERLKKLGVAVTTSAPRPPRVLPKPVTTAAPAKARAPEEKTAKKAAVKTAEAKAAEQAVTTRPHRAHVRATGHPKKAAKKPVGEPMTGEAATKHLNEGLGSMRETAGKPATKPAAKKASGGLESPPHIATKTAAAPKQTAAVAKEAKPETPAVSKPSAEKPATQKAVVAPAPLSASTTPAATSTPAATASAAPTSSATTSSATPAPTTTSATETTATIPTETSASAATTDTTTSSAAKQPQSKGVILPIILIVVGIGVLIVLFRASS